MQINENYVETSMYKKIVDHLQRHNTVIMKGKPGLITSHSFCDCSKSRSGNSVAVVSCVLL